MTITRTHYSTVAIILHWLIAAAIVFQIVLGWRMGNGAADPSAYAVFQLHKSIGISILILSLARLAWRIAVPAPPPPPDLAPWERRVSHLTHIAFYVVMIGLPMTGWILVSASRLDIPTVLFGLAPWPHLPILPDLEPTARAGWEAFGEKSHSALVYLTYLLLALHIGAVVKHQWLDRQALLSRMTAGGRPGLGEPRLWLVAAGLAVCVLAGFLYAPSARVSSPADVAIEMTETPPPLQTAPATDAIQDAALPTPTEDADATTPDTPAAPVVQPLARWTVRQDGAQLRFTTQWSGSPVEGRFRSWDADILFSPDRLESSRITVSIDMRSADTGDAQRDSSLPGADFFDASNHPTAVFSTTRIRRTGQGRYVADGVLNLRGVRSPLSLPFRLDIDGDVATASGGVNLDRVLFGVGQGAYASPDSIPALVGVSFNLTASRDPDA